MGKPKGKSLKSASSETRLETTTEVLPAPTARSPLQAADGHNVDGWADDDIRTYNDLLTEREKLEKEKNELEQKSSRHQTQRALLDENATALDSLFKSQLGGDFKFTGTGKCCLDFDAVCGVRAGQNEFPCKHELCARSKTKGVSWMEMDTIKYYHTRILSEKSQRMQSALRKQRNVELVRVKKDDEEEAALRSRRNAILDKATRSSQAPTPSPTADKGSKLETSALDMLPLASKDFLLDPKNSAILEAAKENENIVRRIRGRLDKIRHDVNAGRVSPADARVKLDQANSEMAEAERKNNEFRQMILDAEPALSQLHHPVVPASATSAMSPANLTTVLQNTLASSNVDAFSQALSVMKGFFSASDPHDVQTAITDLRSVLELNGPMSPVLQKSFGALENMLNKPNAKGFTVDVTTSDGKTRTCSNVVEVMMNLRLKMESSDNPSAVVDPDLNLDEDTMKANLECIKVEDAAKKDMVKIADRMTGDTVESVTTALKKIKAKAILKSPIPPLSDIVLDETITDILFRRSVKALEVEAVSGAGLAQLSGKLTSLIIASARNKPEKYLMMLKSAKHCIDKPTPQVLLDALSKLDSSMPKFVAAQEEKLRKSVAATQAKLLENTPASIVPGEDASITFIETSYLLQGKIFDPVQWTGLWTFLKTPESKDRKKLRAHLYEYYHQNLEEGVWELFRIVIANETTENFHGEFYDNAKKACIDNLNLVASVPEPNLADTVARFQTLGICPGRAAILVGQRMALVIRQNFDVARDMTGQMKSIATDLEVGQVNGWVRSFEFLAHTMTDAFGMLALCLHGEEPLDVPIMAADIVGFLCTFVLGATNAAAAEKNLQSMEWLVLHTLLDLESGSDNSKLLQDVFSRFRLMCQDSHGFRCAPDHTCQAKFSTFAKDKRASLVPKPLRPTKKNLRPQDNPETLPSVTEINKIIRTLQACPSVSLPAVPQTDADTMSAKASSLSLNLKKVAVSVPSIQKNMSSSTSEQGNVEKDTEASTSRKAATTKPLSPALSDDMSSEEENPFPMSERELKIKEQLLKFTDSVDAVHASKDPPAALGADKAAADGVAWQVEEMLVGHVETAYVIATAQRYDGLKAWIEYYYKNTMPVALGGGEEGQ